MASRIIKDGVYSVGALNPNMRVFDIVMTTEYGTSYNSFIVKDEKTALIETCHHRFFAEYLENISEVTPPEKIDYIILNHTEPDHSGALYLLKKHCPNAKIVCTRAAALYLKAITNDIGFECVTVKDSDTLSLGKTELKFIVAPFLHWPDTMFTYAPSLKTVFPCDFLGSHYCEPTMLDKRIVYPEKYQIALKGYFDGIFSPFKPYVRAGLDKLYAIDFDTACVSHGPVLTKDGLLSYVMDKYEEWIKPAQKPELLLPVFYCSAYGFTKELALAATEEIKRILPSAVSEAYDLTGGDMGMLAGLMNSSDGFMVGSPTLNRDAVPPIWALLASIDNINAGKKPVGVFGSYGWSGEAVPSIIARLAAIRINVVGAGFKANFKPSDEEIAGMKAYAEEFAAAMKAQQK